jgi:hypothetical protein
VICWASSHSWKERTFLKGNWVETTKELCDLSPESSQADLFLLKATKSISTAAAHVPKAETE